MWVLKWLVSELKILLYIVYFMFLKWKRYKVRVYKYSGVIRVCDGECLLIL